MATPRIDLAIVQTVCIFLLIVALLWFHRAETLPSGNAASDSVERTELERATTDRLTEKQLDAIAGDATDQATDDSESAVVDVAGSDATKEFARRKEDRRERQIHDTMVNLRSLDLSLPGKVPLAEVMSLCEDWVSAETHRPFMIRPDIKALTDSSGASLYDVSVRDINIPGGSMSFRSALDFILDQTPGPDITWAVRHETVFITTVTAANSDSYMYLRHYDVSHLRDLKIALADTQAKRSLTTSLAIADGAFFSLDDPPGFICGTPLVDSAGHISASGVWSGSWEDALLELISDMSPRSLDWSEGRASIVNNRLVAFQSRYGHESLVRVLDLLASLASEVGPAP